MATADATARILQQIQADIAAFKAETNSNFVEVRQELRMLQAALNDLARSSDAGVLPT
jgi:hypothetical protein